jgi:hypothetical protein
MRIEMNCGSRNSCSIIILFRDFGLLIEIEGLKFSNHPLIMNSPKRLQIHD